MHHMLFIIFTTSLSAEAFPFTAAMLTCLARVWVSCRYHENAEQVGGCWVCTDTCSVMTDEWYAHYSNFMSRLHIRMPEPCQYSLSGCFFVKFSFLSNPAATAIRFLHHTALASDSHNSMISQGKHCQQEEGRTTTTTPQLSLSALASLLLCASLCPFVSVCLCNSTGRI